MSEEQNNPRCNNVVRKLPIKVSTISELNGVLAEQMFAYQRQYSWRKLANEINTFVRGQFKEAYSLIGDDLIEPADLEKQIRAYIPSATYIEKYAKGTPVCYRYANTIANFFEQKYVLTNFNPYEDFVNRLNKEQGLEKEKKGHGAK